MRGVPTPATVALPPGDWRACRDADCLVISPGADMHAALRRGVRCGGVRGNGAAGSGPRRCATTHSPSSATPTAPTRPPPSGPAAAYPEALARLATQVTGHKGQLAALTRRADVADQRIDDLAEEMARALTVRKGPAVIAWHQLDAGEYKAHLADLAAYPSAATAVRPCWQAHKDTVTELGLIWCEFTRIYTAPRPSLDEALVFHDRWLPGVLRRVQQITASCTAGCALDRPAWAAPPNGPHIDQRRTRQ